MVDIRKNRDEGSLKMVALGAVISFSFLLACVLPSSKHPSVVATRFRSHRTIQVFAGSSDTPVAAKKRRDMELAGLDYVTMSVEEQHNYIQNAACMKGAAQRFSDLLDEDQTHLAQEIWKYCILSLHGGVYMDVESPMLLSIDEIVKMESNVAVLSSPDHFEKTIHGSLVMMRKPGSPVADAMVKLLVTAPIDVLVGSPLLVSTTLYDLIAQEVATETLQYGENSHWFLYEHKCSVDPLKKIDNPESVLDLNSYRVNQHCPRVSGYCCQVHDHTTRNVVMVTRYPLLPYQLLPPLDKLPKPLNENSVHYDREELPFISTISEKVNEYPDNELVTPNFFDILLRNNCLPADQRCTVCLRDKQGSNCEKCQSVCPCYCKSLCSVSVEDKFVRKELTVSPPLYARDPSRLIPRIIHQTWFEDVTPDKYPNMSRLIESFKQSGWNYRFYSDEDAGNFLTTHFPAEVKEAYDALRPGAFKADLFRYCALMIHGGVYADMDVMLESNLDSAVGSDVGFMIPVDEPGTPVDKRMCLWNGLIAAAPGHPFLAAAVQIVVNNIRNRFTSVDVDNLFCPDPELSVLHAFDTLFTAGPCILGGAINKAVGRSGQAQFEAGQLKSVAPGGLELVRGLEDHPDLHIPGRTIILHQNKWDMGAHRFTLLEKNLVVAATDMPDYDDREASGDKEHYSKTHAKTGIYGLEKLYVNNHKANEDIKFFVDGSYVVPRSIR